MSKLVVKGFSKDQVTAATPSASVKGMVFEANDSLTFVEASTETRVNDSNVTYEVAEVIYTGKSGNVRIPLSELIRMKNAKGESIITANGEALVTPPAKITINSSEARLRKGVSRNENNKPEDFMYPTSAYKAAEDMFDSESDVAFNYNKLIQSGLIEGVNHAKIQDYIVTAG